MPVLANQENPALIRHNICLSVEASDPDWPPDVVDLVYRLRANPLPSWLASDPQPLLSSDAEDLFAELVEEIQRSETRPSAPPSGRDLDLYQKMSNILGHLFSIVALLRYRSDYASNGFSLGPNTSFLAAFVETCMLASCPDAIVLDGVWFALAKHPYATSDPLSRFLPRYAKATLIALSPFRAHQPEDAMELDEEMRAATPSQGSSQNASNSTQSESDEDDAPQYPRRFTVSEFLENDLEENHTQSLVSEVPSDAESVSEEPLGSDYSRHMMMNDWRGPDCLAALVMAKPGLVEDAISSALYQRRVWGVQSPVLGLAFDPEGTTIQVIIGWLGKDPASNSDLSSVNLLHCPAAHLAHGVLDLNRCSDAVLLAFLLLSSCEQLASDKSLALASSGANLSNIDDQSDLWREDQVSPPEDSACACRGVEAWLGRGPICSVCSLPPDVDCDMPPKTQRNKPGRQAVSEGDQPTDKSPPEVDISDEKSDKKSQVPTPALTILSMSRFANSAGGARHQGSKTSLWLNSHFVVQDSLPKTGTNLDSLLLPSETVIEASRAAWAVRIPHLKDYKAATGLALPLAWKGFDTYPVVTPDQGSLLEHLSTAVERRRADTSRPTLPLSGQLERVLSDKLSDILRFSSQAALTRSSQHANQANEAEHRQAFDGIISLILSSKTDLAPTRIVSLAERPIHVAREDLFDWTHGHKNVSGGDDGPKTFSETQVEQLVNEAEDILAKHNSQLSRDKFVATNKDYAEEVHALFTTNLKIWRDGVDSITSRWQESPRSGKCDVIAAVQIPDFFGVDEATRAKKLGPVILSPDAPTGPSMTNLESGKSVGLERALGRIVSSLRPFDIMAALNFDSYEASQGIVQTQESSVADRQAPAHARITALRPSPSLTQSKGVSSSKSSSEESLPKASAANAQVKKEYEHLIHSLLLPLLACEFKKNKEGYDVTGPNQIRMYLASLVKFLGVLGIYDFHVYGLLTEGTVGGIICAWMSEPQGEMSPGIVHILERNCHGYDIANPLGAVNFAVFLLYLRFTLAPTLKERFQAVKDSVRAKLDANDVSLNWTMEDQVVEYDDFALSRKNEMKKREKAAKEAEGLQQ